MKKFFWKVWLRLNFLTKDVKNDYVAVVSTTGKTLHNADIAGLIKDEGSELQYETLLDVLNRADRLRVRKIQEGYSIQTGVSHIAPRVLGTWLGAEHKFNPAAHRITADMTPSTELHAAFEEVGVEVLGIKESGAYIGLVTDVLTGKTDGTISYLGDIIITGEKIKIAPDKDSTVGVFFVDDEGEDISLDYPMTENNPKRIVCRVPELSYGTYTLKIVTRYVGNTTLLKQNRTIVYDVPLTLVR
ncbi:MAG: DUF4469 domain-containing protein [Dysgonamonadaceae bacterium]|nr:DUF4469 domain-containing protein [Dysgonamonadaceae bacterium]